MSAPNLSWGDLAHLIPTQAAALLVERLESDPSAANQALADRWIAHSEQNRTAWMKMRDAWDVFEGWEGDSTIEQQRREAISHSFRARSNRWKPIARVAAAAAALLVFGGTMLHLSNEGLDPYGTKGATIARFGTPDLIVAAGSRRGFVLPDGTRALLAGGTALDLAFTDTARLIRLDRGEATFNVASDRKRPFRVAVRNHVISDVGTIFSVRRDAVGMRVHLIKGSVLVARGDFQHPSAIRGITMLPGQTLVANPLGERIVPAPTAPPQGEENEKRIAFRDEPLSTAVEQINRTSRVKLVTDPRVAAYRIRGSFRAGDGARFAHTLAELYPIKVRKRPDGTLLLMPRVEQ